MSTHNLPQQLFLEMTPYFPNDPGDGEDLVVDRQFCHFKIKTDADETRVLKAPPRANLECVVALVEDGGNLTLTVEDGSDASPTVVLKDAGSWIKFLSVYDGSDNYWRITGSGGGGLWRTCPSPADPEYKSIVHEYFNDFRASAADYDATNEWTATEDDGDDAQALSADAVSGELLLTNKATTDDNAQQVNLNQESFKLASGKPLWFEARFKTAAGATQIDWSAGLVVAEDLTGVADNMPANGVVFHKEDGDTNIDIASSDNGTNLTSAALGTWDTSYHTLGFHFDGGATGSAVITPYIDGVAGAVIESVTYATMAELAPLFMVRNGDATTQQTMTIDYVRVVQLR